MATGDIVSMKIHHSGIDKSCKKNDAQKKYRDLLLLPCTLISCGAYTWWRGYVERKKLQFIIMNQHYEKKEILCIRFLEEKSMNMHAY